MLKFFRKIRRSVLSENKFSKYLLYAIGEIVLVVIGIIIALQFNNWNEERKNTVATKKAITHIKKELLANQTTIHKANSYHLMVSDTLEKIEMPTTEEEASSALSFWRGLQTKRLRNAAFQTAVQSGVVKDFDPEFTEKLNVLYTLQESYNDFGELASRSLYDQDFSRIGNFKQIAIFLDMAMTDLNYFESDLKKNYTICLQAIDSTLMN